MNRHTKRDMAVVALTLSLTINMLLVMGFQQTRDRDPIQPTSRANLVVPWENLGSITVAQATLAVNGRDYSTVGDLANTKVVDVNLPADGATWEFRFRTDDNADADVIEMWVCPFSAMRDGTEEVFTHGLTADLTGGTGDAYDTSAGTYGAAHFVDTISVSDQGCLTSYEIANSGGNDQALLRVRLRGWNKLTFIATTLQGSTTLYVDGRQYSN